MNAKIYFDDIAISNEAANFLANNKTTSKLDLLSGGEDYELIFSVNKSKEDQLSKLAEKLKINLTKIGEFYLDKGKDKKVDLLTSNNKNIKTDIHGYIH